MTNVSVEANSVNIDQTAPKVLHYLTEKLLKHFSRGKKQTTYVVVSLDGSVNTKYF